MIIKDASVSVSVPYQAHFTCTHTNTNTPILPSNITVSTLRKTCVHHSNSEQTRYDRNLDVFPEPNTSNQSKVDYKLCCEKMSCRYTTHLSTV